MSDTNIRTVQAGRWIARILAIAGVLLAIAAVGVLTTDLTAGNAPLVRFAIVGVVPALCLLAAATAAATKRPSRRIVATAVLGTIGIALACAAHQTWYQQVDATELDAPGPLWPFLIATAIGFNAAAITILLLPGLQRSHISKAAAIALAISIGVVGAAVFVASLAMPFTGLFLAFATLVAVIMLTKKNPRHFDSRS